MIFDPDIIGFGIARAMKTKQRVRKIGEPANEEHDHQPMDIDNQVINIFAVLGCQDGQTQEFFHFNDLSNR